jgi:hypothetical protein
MLINWYLFDTTRATCQHVQIVVCLHTIDDEMQCVYASLDAETRGHCLFQKIIDEMHISTLYVSKFLVYKMQLDFSNMNVAC